MGKRTDLADRLHRIADASSRLDGSDEPIREAAVVIADLLRTMDSWSQTNLNSAAAAIAWLRANAPDSLPLAAAVRDMMEVTTDV